MRLPAAAALAAVLAAAGCAGGLREAPARTVVVEGWAPVGARTRDDARRRAVADAQRRAVESAGGVEIASLAVVDDAMKVRERVSAAARGRVRSYEVLGEAAEEGGVRVRVRAVVVSEARPRGSPGWTPGTGPAAEVSAASSDPDAARAAREAFAAAWTSYGGEEAPAGSAELRVRLECAGRVIDEPRLRPFVSVRVRLAATAAGADGRTVWAASREAAALGVDAAQARERAARAAAAAVARAAAEGLPARLLLSARGDGR